MKKAPYYRRHPLISALLLLLITVAATLAVLLSQFDLVRARLYLTDEMSRILQQPVEIGKLHLTYEQGLAIEIDDLIIGDGGELNVRIPELTGRLRVLPLLDGEILLDQVILTKPRVELARQEESVAQRRFTSTKTGDLFKKFGLSLLTIRHGQLDISRDRLLNDNIPDRIENFNLVLRGWQTASSGYLVLSGVLPNQAGQFTLETQLPPPAQFSQWRQQPLEATLTARQLSRTLLPDGIRDSLPEHIDLILRLQGTPATGSRFSSRVSESLTSRELFEAEGRWLSGEQTEALQNLNGHLLDLPLQGNLLINHHENGLWLSGNLTGADIPLHLLTDTLELPAGTRLEAGTIRSAAIEFDGGLDTLLNYRAVAEITGGALTLPYQESLQEIAFRIELNPQQASITSGGAHWRDQALAFAASVDNWTGTPRFSLQADLAAELSIIGETYAAKLPQHLSLAGTAPTRLALTGTPEQIDAEVMIQLDAAEVRFEPLLDKRPQQPAQLQVRGHWQPTLLEIELASLQLGDARIETTGALPLPVDQSDLATRLLLTGQSLLTLQDYSPLLNKLEARGGFSTALNFHAADNYQGELTLEDVGAHLTWLIGDIGSTSGHVSFDQNGMTFDQLTLKLGSSPLQVSGNLRNWSDFLLDLRVQGDEIAARDLIFANPDQVVFDLDGRLHINRGGIIFDPVRVQLENGTDATVSGYVRNFSNPETYLEIDSFEHTDVLEIIKLFQGPPKKTTPRRKEPGPPVRILARAAQGTLGGLKFQQAEGLITVRRGLFTLHPLRFNHQDGFCLARVEYDSGRLKISGHLEDFNANTLYREALHARGLVTGKLRGDFYIEGNGTGQDFWASSRGGAHLQIHDGALRKFRSLARVFSLLNISQLFELKLPDMDSKGMPFTRLEASLDIEKGVLSTDNLTILSNAMNMSLIGSRNILDNTIDLTVGVKPLRTVDKIITAIPVAGWLLAGEEKALLTAHFRVQGSADDPSVTAIPATSLSKTVLGILQRTFGLPGKLISDPAKLFGGGEGPSPPTETAPAPTQESPPGQGEQP